MTYLLDTNICVDHLRKKSEGTLRKKLQSISPAEIVVISIVVAELLEGAYVSQQREKNLVETGALLRLFRSLPMDDAVAEQAAIIGAELRMTGHRIEQNDLYIAATAITHGLILITRNRRHFERIAKLRIED